MPDETANYLVLLSTTETCRCMQKFPHSWNFLQRFTHSSPNSTHLSTLHFYCCFSSLNAFTPDLLSQTHHSHEV